MMAIGLIGCALLRQPVLAIIALALVPLGHCASYGPFWSMPTQFLTGPAAAAGIALGDDDCKRRQLRRTNADRRY